MIQQRKAVINLTAFSLILILLFGTFIFVYFYYQSSIVDVEENNQKEELLIAATSFRSELNQMISENGTSIYYNSTLDPEETLLVLYEKNITAQRFGDERLLNVNISTLGSPFCSTYNFSPILGANFTFNGSCFSMFT